MSLPNRNLDGALVSVKTAVATPAAMFAGGSQLAGRTRLRMTNLSGDTRMRIGRVTANLQRDGSPVEPGDTLTIYPDSDTIIYGASEGRPIQIQIEEA